MLGAAFLALTGAEAMYADMGHFGRGPMRLGWFAVVLPSLALNYFGQGALLLTDPTAHENPFFHLAPDWFHFPLVGFATAATIIASQALISGAFSLTQQAIQLGFLPRVRILHTASHTRGQIYVPLVNWLLAVGTIGAVVGFGTSEALAGAYGLAVALDGDHHGARGAGRAPMGLPPDPRAGGERLLLPDRPGVLRRQFLKLFHGGWFPLLLAAAITFVMLTWRSGAKLVEGARRNLRAAGRRPDRDRHQRMPGAITRTAVFLASAAKGVPLALTQFIRHNHVMHERILLLTVVIEETPRVPDEGRVDVIEVMKGITRVILHFGFMENNITIAKGLQAACDQGKICGIDPATPGCQIKEADVTGAIQPLFRHSRHDGAHQVRTLVAKGHELVGGRPDQQAAVVTRRVMEQERASHGNIVNPGNPLQRGSSRPPPPEVLRRNPKLPDREGAADQDQETGEVPAGDKLVPRNIDRKVLSPLRLRQVRLIGLRRSRRRDDRLGGHGGVGGQGSGVRDDSGS